MSDRLGKGEERTWRANLRHVHNEALDRIWATLDAVRADLAAEREARGRLQMALADIKANAHWKPSAWSADRALRALGDS